MPHKDFRLHFNEILNGIQILFCLPTERKKREPHATFNGIRLFFSLTFHHSTEFDFSFQLSLVSRFFPNKVQNLQKIQKKSIRFYMVDVAPDGPVYSRERDYKI